MDIKDFCNRFNKHSKEYSMTLSKKSDKVYVMTEMGTVCNIYIKDDDFLTFIDEVKKVALRFSTKSGYKFGLEEDINQFLSDIKDEIRELKLNKLDI